MDNHFDIIILGGGFTGLAAATHCAQQGHSVCLVEKEKQLGGLAAGFRDSCWEWSLEHYYHHWFTSDTYVKKYAEIWNAHAGLLTLTPSTVMETSSGEFAKLDSPLALLRYKDISLTSRVRLALCLVYLKLTRNWKRLEKTTAEKWCLRFMGREAYEAIWKPLLVGKFSEKYAAQINMAWLWARLKCRTQHLMTYEKGFMGYIAKAEKWLKENGVTILKHSPVQSLKPKSDNFWEVKVANQPALHSKRVIAGIPTPALEQLTGSTFSASQTPKSLGAVVVIFSLKKELGDEYWYSLRKKKEYPFLAVINHTRFVSRKHFNEENIVYVADYLDPSSVQYQFSDGEFTRVALKTLTKINPKLSLSDVNKTWVFKSPYAQPLAFVNASKQVPPVTHPGLPNLFHGSLAHIYPWDRGTNFALELGENIANKALQSLNH